MIKMASRKDLSRMHSNMLRVKNPLKQFHGPMSSGPGDEKKEDGLKPVKDGRNILEKGYDYLTGGDSRSTMSIGGKTVEFTDAKGNSYDKDKNRIN